MTIILLKSDELTKNTILGGNLDKDKYLPCIKNCQKTLIKPFLGEALYNKICNDFSTGSLSGDYETLYEDYIKDMVINGSAELYLAVGAYNITNAGITKIKTDTTETVDYKEIDQLTKFSRRLFQHYKEEAEKFLKTANIPEYAGVKRSKHKTVGGWILKRKN